MYQLFILGKLWKASCWVHLASAPPRTAAIRATNQERSDYSLYKIKMPYTVWPIYRVWLNLVLSTAKGQLRS